MTHARRMTVFDDRPGLYHCVTRCVRQAFLCGDVGPCSRSGEERRAWVERRILELAESFAVGVYAWAAMSNHCHIVLLLDPLRPLEWSDAEVARRWCRISQFPGRPAPAKTQARREQALLEDPERLQEIRARLGSLSWYMRFVNEGVARRANVEDGCKGHFWDGRFKSQNLLDEGSALAAMAYVDLNPVRAGIADQLDQCSFTSIRWRLQDLPKRPDTAARQLQPVAGLSSSIAPPITLQSYVGLVTRTGREQRPGKRGKLGPQPPDPTLACMVSERWWQLVAGNLESRFAAFVGTPDSLVQTARRLGRKWLRGSRIKSASTLPAEDTT